MGIAILQQFKKKTITDIGLLLVVWFEGPDEVRLAGGEGTHEAVERPSELPGQGSDRPPVATRFWCSFWFLFVKNQFVLIICINTNQFVLIICIIKNQFVLIYISFKRDR